MSTAQPHPQKKQTWDRVYIEYLAVFSVGWLDMNTSLILDPPPIPFSEPNYIKIVWFRLNYIRKTYPTDLSDYVMDLYQ